MKPDISIRKLFPLVSIIMLLVISCSFTGASNNDEEIEALKQQVSLLGTQNALLEQKSSSSEKDSEEIQAPPPPSTETAPPVTISSPTPESLPTEPVLAGTPIIFDGWAMTVSKEIVITDYHKAWGLKIFLRNMSDSKRIFRFKNSAITAKDNLGNIYPPSFKGSGSADCEEIYHQTKNLEVETGETETITSDSYGYNNCDRTHGIDRFDGLIPIEASQLIIHFDDFGPFTNIDVVIDL